MIDLKDPTASLYITQGDGIGRIVLNRVAKKNALTCAMWEGVAAAARAHEEDPAVRVIQLVSEAPGAFAAGADIKELTEIAKDPALRERNRQAIRDAQRTLARLAKPSIAVIDGPCVGGGCGLAAHCDFRLATPRSRFAITPAKLGLVYPLSDLKRLHDLVGAQGARRLLFTAEAVEANVALAMGLIDEIVPPDTLEDRARALAQRIASLSPFSMRETKKILLAVEDGAVDDTPDSIDIFLKAHTGPDAREGLAAFLEKRPAAFDGAS